MTVSTSLTPAQILGTNEEHLCHLRDVLGQATGEIAHVSVKQRLTSDAAIAFVKMQAAAAEDGVDVQILSGFRSFAQQLAIWQAKWCGLRPILNDRDQPVDTTDWTDAQKMHAILRWSAIPGGSRHHWGTDVDLYCAAAVSAAEHRLQLVASEYAPGGICGEMTSWLNANAHLYGFVRPYDKDRGGIGLEPWHYSYQPQADNIMQAFPLAELHALLLDSEIDGKDTLLSHLPELFARYICNNNL
jgi:LAS superfamily LD-carboxypeptidase LdcB